MKKTVTANISGTVFHIEEDAFLKLGRYLDSIRAKFTGTDGREEIMTDIEARIAELFQQRLEGRNVVSIADVEHVIGIMGQPEDYETDEQATAGGAGAGSGGNDPTRTRKRLFRDPDDNWLGGVLGGVAAYLNMDVLWARLIFLLLLFPLSFGSLLIVYVLMWILVPRADSTADRLQMRGEAVNVDNIKRVFEEGGERFKKGAEQMADEARDLGKSWAPKGKAWGREAASVARSTGRTLGSVFAKIIGVLFLIIALCMFMGLLTAFVGASWSNWGGAWAQGDVGSIDLGGLLFASTTHAIWFAVGAFILLAVPVIGLFIAGFRLLVDTRSPRWLGWSLCIAWLA
ncbi:MAG: PspC domain-containing protein, partial [Flavobacteriales bacterium]